MRRRQFLLGACAATGALAGCTGAARDDPDTPTAEIEPVPADSTPSYQFQQGAQNTGVAAEPLDADGSWWETQIDPVDRAFGAADGRVVAGNHGTLRVLDASTGERERKKHLGAWISGIPALADETAYVPCPYVEPRLPGGIAAVDITDGSVHWRAIPRVDVRQSPTLTDDRLYAIGGSDDRNVVLAVDANTGKFQWQQPIGEDSPPPAVADGLVFVAVAGPEDSGLYALDPATGDEQWHVPLAGDAGTAPTIVEDTVYVGTDGALHAVPTDGGEERWRVDLGDSIGDGIAATNDALYVPVDSSMVKLDAAGERRWRTELPAPPTPPTVAGDALVTGAGDVVCLDVADGSERWRHPVFSRSIGDAVYQGIRATPAVSDGKVYAASYGGSVFECGNPDALG